MQLAGTAGSLRLRSSALEHSPTKAELERVLSLLGIDHPRKMMRTQENVYRELELASAARDALLDAMVEHPILIDRLSSSEPTRRSSDDPRSDLELFES